MKCSNCGNETKTIICENCGADIIEDDVNLQNISKGADSSLIDEIVNLRIYYEDKLSFYEKLHKSELDKKETLSIKMLCVSVLVGASTATYLMWSATNPTLTLSFWSIFGFVSIFIMALFWISVITAAIMAIVKDIKTKPFTIIILVVLIPIVVTVFLYLLGLQRDG